ncbi:MAG: chromosomal replication initiator protein DnaA [Phycisphaerae bacterium]|nr:MAG: chromosomal replication initiator protein DnaA [Phycisphaerae bacterium]
MSSIAAPEWKSILDRIRSLHPALIRGWFSSLKPIDLAGGVLRVRAGNLKQVRYLEDECRSVFIEAAQAVMEQLVTTTFETDAPNEIADDEGYPLSISENNQLQLNDDYVFDNFVVGAGNRMAHAAAVAAAENPGQVYNPLFIHGDVGLGKTHLLQAICHETRRLGTCPTTLYISCETFANHFIEAVERGAMNQFRFHYRHVDLLVIDDIQFLGARERSQEEFFHTFNTLHQSQKQIVLSADCSPSEIPTLENRLVSRFKSGLVASIDAPCMETRMAILRKKSRLRCIEVPEDVIEYVATNIHTNIRDLEGALLRLDAMSQASDGTIDVELARRALADGSEASVISIQQIIDVVTSHFGVRVKDLQSKKRPKSISHPRQVCMFLARELTEHSLEEVGGYFGGRDHSTVLHANRTIKKMIDTDAKVRRSVENLRATLRARQNGIS